MVVSASSLRRRSSIHSVTVSWSRRSAWREVGEISAGADGIGVSGAGADPRLITFIGFFIIGLKRSNSSRAPEMFFMMVKGLDLLKVELYDCRLDQ